MKKLASGYGQMPSHPGSRGCGVNDASGSVGSDQLGVFKGHRGSAHKGATPAPLKAFKGFRAGKRDMGPLPAFKNKHKHVDM